MIVLYAVITVAVFFVVAYRFAKDGGEPGEISAYALVATIAWPVLAVVLVFWGMGWIAKYFADSR